MCLHASDCISNQRILCQGWVDFALHICMICSTWFMQIVSVAFVCEKPFDTYQISLQGFNCQWCHKCLTKISFVCKFYINISLMLTRKMLFVQTSKRSSSLPKTEIEVELTHCLCEVDITLVDRIHALLNPRPFTTRPTNSVYRSFQYSAPMQVSCKHPLNLITKVFSFAHWK